MPGPAAHTARRRPPTSGRARAKRRTRVDSEFLRTWLPPALAGLLFLVLYILGNLDVIETLPALAAGALLLTLIVLFFPMRYAYRLHPRGRLAAACLALAWIAAVYGPIYLRIYPAPRLATIDVFPDALPAALPAAGHGPDLDLVIEGHLEPAVAGSTRAARYRLTLTDSSEQAQEFSGKFIESWGRQAGGSGETLEVRHARTANRVVLHNPSQEDLSVTDLMIRGRAEKRLTLSLHPHTQLPLGLALAVATLLMLGALSFDRRTGAGSTAASLTIATAASLTATFAFQSVASPQPTFRELFGAAIVGALIGGPLGGLAAWLLRGRKPPRFKSVRHVD